MSQRSTIREMIQDAIGAGLSVLKAILDEMADGADAESKVLSAIIRGKSTLQ